MCTSQKPITPRLVDISKPGSTFGAPSRPAWPKCTSRPNGASASSDCSNVRPPTISSTTSTRLPSFASRSAARELLRARVDGRVRAEPLGELALLGRRRDADHAAGAEPLGELHRQRPDAARRGVHHDASRPRAAARSCAAGATPSCPAATSASAAPSLDALGHVPHRRRVGDRALGVAAAATSATTRRPSGVVPTTSPPGTSGSSAGARYEFSAWWVSA